MFVPLAFVHLTYTKGKFKEAEPLYEKLQKAQEKYLGPDHEDVAATLNIRAFVLLKQVRH